MGSSGWNLCTCVHLLVGCTVPGKRPCQTAVMGNMHVVGSEAAPARASGHPLLSSGPLGKYLTCYVTYAGSRQGLLPSLSQSRMG